MNNSLKSFTNTGLEKLVQKNENLVIKDAEITGFRFKVGKLNSQYFFQKRINGTTNGSVYITIGNYSEISAIPGLSGKVLSKINRSRKFAITQIFLSSYDHQYEF